MAPPSAFPDNQHTSAEPSGSNKTSTRPCVSPSSTWIGAPNVAPASAENATFTCGSPPAPVNHATATLRPAAAIDGPFTGQPLISQLSACTTCGFPQPPLACRTE